MIEYRAIDAAGNIATAKKFVANYIDPEKTEVGPVGGTVPATLSLTLGAAPATFGAFTPGLAKDYTASMAADVITTAGDAALSVSDPGANPGKLVNGAFALPTPLQVNASSPAGTGGALGPVGSTAPDLQRAGQPRPGDGELHAAHRRDRPAAHRRLHEDADVHPVHHYPVGARPLA